jgi:hypothetical protein
MRRPSSHSDARLCVGGVRVKIARSAVSLREDCNLFSAGPIKLLMVILVVEVGFGACDRVFRVDVLEMLEASSFDAETFEMTELMVLKSIFSGN